MRHSHPPHGRLLQQQRLEARNRRYVVQSSHYDVIESMVQLATGSKDLPSLSLSSVASKRTSPAIYADVRNSDDFVHTLGSIGPVLPLYEAAVGAALTLESCGAACYKSNPNNGIGGVVGGNQCFCGSSADLSSPAAKARSLASRAQVLRAMHIARL